MTDDPSLVEEILQDYRTASISEQDKAILDYAYKLTRTPWEVEEGDVEKLRQVGLGDRDIVNINAITAYYNLMNRIAQGLGLETDQGPGAKTADTE